MELATACETCGAMRWIARSGKRRSMALPEGWLPVSKARKMPLPDTSWMADPWPRTKFAGWMGWASSDGIPSEWSRFKKLLHRRLSIALNSNMALSDSDGGEISRNGK
jgi:hypothetical protein